MITNKVLFTVGLFAGLAITLLNVDNLYSEKEKGENEMEDLADKANGTMESLHQN